MDSPSSGLAPLDAGAPSRSPEGTAMLGSLGPKHIACGPAWGGPAPVRLDQAHAASAPQTMDRLT